MFRTPGPSVFLQPPDTTWTGRTRAWITSIAHGLDRWPARTLAMGLLLCLPGCGTNLEEVLLQTLVAVTRTQVDLALTDIANDLADSREGDDDDAEDDDEDDDGGDEGNGDGGNGDGGNGGVTVDGTALFATNCAVCHGEDGTGGIGPDITGNTAPEVTTGLELATHDAISLNEEEITAIAEFLGGSATDGGPIGDVAAGEQLFTGFACGACHCPDATGGCALDAPSLVGVNLDTLDDRLVGDVDHPGGKFDMTTQDLTDLQAYLASL